MAPLKSTRVAWSIAIASLALWATSAPLTWSQAAVKSAGQLFDQIVDETTTTSTTTVSQTVANETISTTADEVGAVGVPCPTLPPAQTQPAPAAPAPAAPAPVGGSQQGTFHLCGADADVARSIEQLIAGRSFNASLVSHGDGCAELTVSVTSPAIASGRAASTLKISPGSGRSLSIQIVSAGGSTHVDIGQGQ
jgi:hypothetical protein